MTKLLPTMESKSPGEDSVLLPRSGARAGLIMLALTLVLIQVFFNDLHKYQTVSIGGNLSEYDPLYEAPAISQRRAELEGGAYEEKKHEENEEEEVPKEPSIESEEEEPSAEIMEETKSISNEEMTSRVTIDSATTIDFSPPSLEDTSIRRWGCARNETPFVFVHIGKAGGGGVRARIAASAVDYNRSKWFEPLDDPNYYYPIYDEQGTLHKGKLLHSRNQNFLPHFPHHEKEFRFQRTFQFESSMACHATTPLGHAIGCHQEKTLCQAHRDHPSVDPDRCDVVYMGHNVLGTELNFLPTGYLLNWWNQSQWAQQDAMHNPPANRVATQLANRYKRSHRILDATKKNPAAKYCKDGSHTKRFFYNQQYEKCILPSIQVADLSARMAMGDIGDNYGPLYASLPVLRVTMLREPFSWFKSKFFWQENMAGKDMQGFVLASKGERVDDLTRKRIIKEGKQEQYGDDPIFVKCDDEEQLVTGWGKQTALEYIFYLCGEHCMGKWQAIQDAYQDDPVKLKEEHLEYLNVMEQQASYNLRNSFAVVGLLQETDEFFDMITKRVHYMDTSLNPEVKGERHTSGHGAEQQRCSAILGDKEFQMKMMNKCPEIRVAVRLYKLGVQVNRFQMEELEQCSA